MKECGFMLFMFCRMCFYSGVGRCALSALSVLCVVTVAVRVGGSSSADNRREILCKSRFIKYSSMRFCAMPSRTFCRLSAKQTLCPYTLFGSAPGISFARYCIGEGAEFCGASMPFFALCEQASGPAMPMSSTMSSSANRLRFWVKFCNLFILFMFVKNASPIPFSARRPVTPCGCAALHRPPPFAAIQNQS